MTTPIVTPLPVLDRTSPGFRAAVDLYLGTQVPTFSTQINALADDLTAKSTAVTEAVAAAMAAGLANAASNAYLSSENRIQTGLDRAATLADRTQTGLDRAAVAAALGSIADGPVYSVAGATGAVVLKTLNGQALVGAGNIVIDSSIYRDARTANTALAAADKGKFVDITGGTFTQTFVAATTLGSGWYVYMRNSGTGVITLDPSGAETIDGAATLALYPGHTRLVQCDGSALRTLLVVGEEQMVVADEKPNGSGGGGGTTNAWTTRTLNTVRLNTINGASLASDRITLPAGTYHVKATCPAMGVEGHIARLYNQTSASVAVYGSSDFAQSSLGANHAEIDGVVAISTASILRLDHFTQAGGGGTGFGFGTTAASGAPSVFSQISIRKLA